ncbi:sulfurtransferase [Spiractinospora alimapuensis]|nr:sulfurtransferase [Spiractinospora alimapuensis]
MPPIVTVDWLRHHVETGPTPDDLALVDVRWYLDGRSGLDAYRAGHIPGAVFVDLDTDLAAPADSVNGRHPLPTPDDFAAALGRAGVGDATPVVAYDDTGGGSAARLVWMLRVLGLPAALLDGGLPAWDGDVATGDEFRPPTARTTLPWPDDRFLDTATVRGLLDDPSTLLVDARARGRYTGQEPAAVDPRPGHVPGAYNAPWQDLLDASGQLGSPERVRARLTELGVPDDARNPIAYCGSGVSACLDLVAMEHAGLPAGRLYVGSWSAWGADHTLPNETTP